MISSKTTLWTTQTQQFARSVAAILVLLAFFASCGKKDKPTPAGGSVPSLTNTISVAVNDPNGKPISNNVQFFVGTETLQASWNSENQTYTVSGIPAGQQTLEVYHPEYQGSDISVNVSAKAEKLTVLLQPDHAPSPPIPRPGTIDSQAKDPGLEKKTRILVYDARDAYKTTRLSGAKVTFHANGTTNRANDMGGGIYEITGVASGSYNVRVELAKYIDYASSMDHPAPNEVQIPMTAKAGDPIAIRLDTLSSFTRDANVSFTGTVIGASRTTAVRVMLPGVGGSKSLRIAPSSSPQEPASSGVALQPNGSFEGRLTLPREGSYTVSLRAEDGDRVAEQTLTATFDQTPPVVSINGRQATQKVDLGPRSRVQGTATDAVSGIERISFDNGRIELTQNGDFGLEASSLSEGSHTLLVYDRAGNLARVVVNVAAPPEPPPPPPTSPLALTVQLTSDSTTAAVSGTATGGVGPLTITAAGGRTKPGTQAVAKADGTFQLPPIARDRVESVVTVTVTDSKRNTTSRQVTIPAAQPNAPPVVIWNGAPLTKDRQPIVASKDDFVELSVADATSLKPISVNGESIPMTGGKYRVPVSALRIGATRLSVADEFDNATAVTVTVVGDAPPWEKVESYLRIWPPKKERIDDIDKLLEDLPRDAMAYYYESRVHMARALFIGMADLQGTAPQVREAFNDAIRTSEIALRQAPQQHLNQVWTMRMLFQQGVIYDEFAKFENRLYNKSKGNVEMYRNRSKKAFGDFLESAKAAPKELKWEIDIANRRMKDMG